MSKPVINEIKLEEGEFNPSKDIPDVLEDGRIMTVYWTLQGGEMYTFVQIQMSEGNVFALYGAIHGKIYPWQIELASLERRLLCIVKATNEAKAQIKLFEKAQEVCDQIVAAKKPSATKAQKILGWKNVSHIENLYQPKKLLTSWFSSVHGGTIERLLDGLLSDEELKEIQFKFDEMDKSKRLLRRKRTSKEATGQLQFGF